MVKKLEKRLNPVFKHSRLLVVSGAIALIACSNNTIVSQSVTSSAIGAESIKNNVQGLPASRFDLTHWKLTLPTDSNLDGKVDGVNTVDLQKFSHEHFFHLDKQGHLVFTAPNKGGTTPNSSNTRSELRYMSRGFDDSVNAHDPLNNFAIASHPDAEKFASIGGKMEATLHVDHAPRNSLKPKQSSSYAAVIGQVHSIKYKNNLNNGFGYGNEPLKIIYKKWPNHQTGSVYWNYERNLENGKDISYLVWGRSPKDSADPGEQGIALGEDFSYIVNIYQDTMYLEFDSPRLGMVRHQINLANNIDVNGNVDIYDNPKGYTGDGHYFKAGVYNQCRALAKNNERQGRCPGTGDWLVDRVNGDYAQVSFSKLIVTKPDPK